MDTRVPILLEGGRQIVLVLLVKSIDDPLVLERLFCCRAITGIRLDERADECLCIVGNVFPVLVVTARTEMSV